MKMKTDPITKKTFQPRNPIHSFESSDSFIEFIDQSDPMKEFKPQKREINWSPIERRCAECGDSFLAVHPAMMYCEEHRPNEEE
jgi:hypothetical protein